MIINKLYFFNKSDYTLTKDQKCDVSHKINIINVERMKLVLIIFMISELLFITLNDIPYIINPASNIVWNDSRFFILHLLILIISFIGFVLIQVLRKFEGYKLEKIYKLLVIILTILLLSLMAIINGLDQVIHESVSSVFIANLIIFGSVISLKFPLNLTVYTIPFMTYIGGLVIFHHSDNFLISNLINGVIFFLVAMLISSVIYNYHYDRIAKDIVLEETIFKLNYLSNHDPLTGLMNRRYFADQVAEKMKIIKESKKQAALILLDIDYFKQVNDNFGHPVGDIVLMDVGHILMDQIKTNDLATRWGGEEFLIFLCETSMEEAYALADNIRLEIQNKVIQADTFQIKITASFGIAPLKNNLSDYFETSFKAADVALYQAKDQGRNKVIMSSLDIEEEQ